MWMHIVDKPRTPLCPPRLRVSEASPFLRLSDDKLETFRETRGQERKGLVHSIIFFWMGSTERGSHLFFSGYIYIYIYKLFLQCFGLAWISYFARWFSRDVIAPAFSCFASFSRRSSSFSYFPAFPSAWKQKSPGNSQETASRTASRTAKTRSFSCFASCLASCLVSCFASCFFPWRIVFFFPGKARKNSQQNN